MIKISDRKSQRFHLHKTICLDQFSNSLALLLFLFNFINILSLIVYVVVNFLSQVISVVLLFLGMVINANEVETKEK